MPNKSFDNYVSDVNQEPITFDFKGRHYRVERPSFILKLKIGKLFSNQNKDRELDPAELYDIIEMLLGEENFKHFSKEYVDDQQVVDIISYILNPYAATENKSEDKASPNAGKGRPRSRSQ